MKRVSVYEEGGLQFNTAKEAKHYARVLAWREKILENYRPEVTLGDVDALTLRDMLELWNQTAPEKPVKADAPPQEPAAPAAPAPTPAPAPVEPAPLDGNAAFIQV